MSVNPLHPVKPAPYLMQNQIQHYEWGARDREAFIPQLLGISPKPGVPYGELWMGAHPKAPSHIEVDDELIALDRWIARYPQELLGTAVSAKFNRQLPFLLKVLSAGEALSIQAHPNKTQARLLHAASPEHYPDDNHKPEVAVALDSLTALMGFRPFDELSAALERYPEISEFVGMDVAERVQRTSAPDLHKQHDLTKMLLTALITRSVTHPDVLADAIDRLAHRLDTTAGSLTEAETLFIDLRRKYPGADIGLFSIFMLNLVHLAEGEAIFAEAGVPHAYIKGNIIECMANSDNVVRIGLTPKYKDAKTLLDILKYEPGAVKILGGKPSGGTVVYRTPAPEFRVSRFNVSPGVTRHVSMLNKPSILIVTQGEITLRYAGGADAFRRGQSIFIPAILSEYSILSTQPSVIFQADVPI
ncbi:MAG: mannose-6-phosphate isomerase, class I [Chloroflexi bacterium]|nr:mannose-6-phosphate isomerase, class I [Chloroflexota bacterium]